MRPLLFCALLSLALPLHADDGAASIAAGGLVLMKREPRITMAKELLEISPRKVIVNYDFRNDSDTDIITVVAFPVPPYRFGETETTFGDPAFNDFQLTVNGKPAVFSVEARAYVGKREVTTTLVREHIDTATFGHWSNKQNDYTVPPPDFQHASSAAKQRLVASGAFDKDGGPNWSVTKKYYWTQTFPAHQTLHIRHEYTPAVGGTNSVRYGLEAETLPQAQRSDDNKDLVNEIDSLCLEPTLKKSLLDLSRKGDTAVPFNYVDFILTTANTWKTPIEDFTLIVDRPAPDKNTSRALISFCWAGPIEKADSTHFTAHLTNLVPNKELRIGFVYIDKR